MNKILRNKVTVLAVIGLIGVAIAGLGIGFIGNAQAQDNQKFSTSAIWTWPPPATNETQVTSASSGLNRNKNGVQYNFKTGELDPGVYTMWFVVFNDPNDCDGACGADDLMAGRGNSAAFWDSGRVVGPNGEANFSGNVSENFIPTGPDQILMDNTGGQGMIDAETAEVHLVVRSHGPKATETNGINIQLTTFNGECRPNPDSCANMQFAVHLPPTN